MVLLAASIALPWARSPRFRLASKPQVRATKGSAVSQQASVARLVCHSKNVFYSCQTIPSATRYPALRLRFQVLMGNAYAKATSAEVVEISGRTGAGALEARHAARIRAAAASLG